MLRNSAMPGSLTPRHKGNLSIYLSAIIPILRAVSCHVAFLPPPCRLRAAASMSALRPQQRGERPKRAARKELTEEQKQECHGVRSLGRGRGPGLGLGLGSGSWVSVRAGGGSARTPCAAPPPGCTLTLTLTLAGVPRRLRALRHREDRAHRLPRAQGTAAWPKSVRGRDRPRLRLGLSELKVPH